MPTDEVIMRAIFFATFVGVATVPTTHKIEPSQDFPKDARPAEGTKAQITCDSFKPAENPQDIPLVITYVSDETGVPADVLFGVWHAETNGSVYGYARGCDITTQLAIRCHHNKGCKQIPAIKQIAAMQGWKTLKHVRASCGTSTWKKNTGNFGGCIGPMQVTPTEWLADKETAGKDPLNLCWSMLATGHRLKRHHDQSYRWLRSDASAWSWAVQRYHGSPGKELAKKYAARVDKKRKLYLRLLADVLTEQTTLLANR